MILQSARTGRSSGARRGAHFALLALLLALFPGSDVAGAGVGTSPSRGVAFLQESRSGDAQFVAVELSAEETKGRRFAGSLTVAGRSYEAEGTTSESGRRSVVGRGDGTVVATGQVEELGDGAELFDGKIRRNHPDEQEKGVVVELQAFAFDPDSPPPTGVVDIYDGSFQSAATAREGRAILELEDEDEDAATAFRCDAELSVEQENDVVTMNGFTGECSVSGDERFVGVLMGEAHDGGANLLFLDGTYSTGDEQPPRDVRDDDDVAPGSTARIEADYILRSPDGAEERGTLSILAGGEQSPRCIPVLRAEPEHA